MKSVEKKHRRFLAAILALCLLLGLCPFTPPAQAEETTTTTVAGSTTIEDAQSVPIGESVTTTLVAGKNYYAIPDVKAWQQISVELDKAYNSNSMYLSFYNPDGRYWQDGGNGYQLSKMAYTDGKYYFVVGVSQSMTVSFTVTLYDNDANEPNNTLETAAPIEPGKTVDGVLFSGDADYFAITTTKPYQYIVVDEQTADTGVNVWGRDAAGKGLQSVGNSTRDVFRTAEAGTYYLYLTVSGGRASYSFTVTLCDNDANEPNDTKEQATTLHSGESTEFTLAGSDVDYFKVTTTLPGQDIALTVSGYNYTNRDERFSLYFDPAGDLKYNNTSCAAYAEIDANRTLYLHAAAAGEHYIALQRNGTTPLTRTLSVEILDGDQNEPNDTRETATRLTLGTDETFMVGGFGDEDWFAFEAVPGEGEKKLYTLRFTGLNTDYSDSFYYDLYAPNGAAVVKQTKVNIQHVYGFSCDQQGQYYVRVYAGINGKGYMGNYPRSVLRICVSEGGDDPYENNDTWLTAANVPVGNIQHVLASTVDTDWFCFTVPENDMTLHLTSTKLTTAALYRAETLTEYDEDSSKSEFAKVDKYSRGSISFTDTYFKLTDAGLYYIKLTADSSYIDPDIRTTGIELLPATDEENNDTWKKATPLYEGVPQRFTISASNDVDWFKIVVPEDGTQLYFPKSKEYSFCYIYEERAFETAGDDAAFIDSFNRNKDYANTTKPLSKGTYYLEVNPMNDIGTESLMVYKTLPAEWGTSLETARQLGVGEWAEYYNSTYFCIGERRAGEVVRVSRDAAGWGGSVYLLDAAGKTVGVDYYANQTFHIPADGRYYLKTQVNWAVDDNGRPLPNRLRYDVGSGEEKASAIESADSLTLLEGETMFLDLRCAPYGASSGNNRQTFYVNTPSCVYYYDNSGYLTAQSAGTGTLTVSLNGDSPVKKEIPVTVLAKDSLKVEKLSIERAPETLSLGASADLTANYTLAGGAVLTNPQKAVTWTSSDPKVLYVSLGGKVTAVGSGSATVTASVGGASVAKTITVTAAEEPKDTVTSITLNKYSLTLYVGEMGEQLAATILPEGSTASVVWQSSNPNVATVTEKGLVQAVTPGTSVITATAGGRHVSCIVSVLAARVRVTGVSFDETEHKIPVRGTAKLTATVAPANATVKTLIWTSDDDSIATVSRTGIVTALHVGTTTIRATSVDGNHSAEITVTVTPSAELGDVNGDGYIDSADAMLCLRYSVGLAKLTEEQKRAANVNHDSFVDAGDAIKILRYDAKLIDSLN